MFLVQLLLPLTDNDGRPFGHAAFDRVFRELTEKFGGVTAFQRSPGEGAWRSGGEVSRDDVVIYEVMAPDLDREWWRLYRSSLEDRFRQEEILIRAIGVEQL